VPFAGGTNLDIAPETLYYEVAGLPSAAMMNEAPPRLPAPRSDEASPLNGGAEAREALGGAGKAPKVTLFEVIAATAAFDASIESFRPRDENPSRLTCWLALVAAAAAPAGDLSFSDPANLAPPPPGAIGQAVRSPDLDVLPGFPEAAARVRHRAVFLVGRRPAHAGAPLGWQLEQMSAWGLGYQINYAQFR